MKKLSRLIISFVICFSIIVGNILPTLAVDVNTLKNGSPLTSSSWTSSEDNPVGKADHIALAMYMSSCCYAGIDNFQTAFDPASKEGQKGGASKYLNIQNDPSGMISTYTNKLASLQTTYNKETDKKIYLIDDNGEITGNPIKVKDLIKDKTDVVKSLNLINAGTLTCGSILLAAGGVYAASGMIGTVATAIAVKAGLLAAGSASTVIGTPVAIISGAVALLAAGAGIVAANIDTIKGKYPIAGNKYGLKLQKSDGTEETLIVYDGKNNPLSYNSLHSCYVYSCNYDRETLVETINNHAEDELYLDRLGNVCALNESQSGLIIIPAYANPYIFNANGEVYNLLGLNIFANFESCTTVAGNGESQTDSESKTDTFSKEYGITILNKDDKAQHDYSTGNIKPHNIIYTYYDIESNDTVSQPFLKKYGTEDAYRLIFHEDLKDAFAEEGIINIYAQTIFFNYLIMAKGAFVSRSSRGETTITINEDYFEIPETFNEYLNNISGMSVEQKTNEVLNNMMAWITQPKKFAEQIAAWIESVLVKLYEVVSDYDKNLKGFTASTIGFTTMEDVPLVGSIQDWMYNNLSIVLIILLVVGLLASVLTKNPLGVSARILLCAVLFVVYPKIFNLMSIKVNEVLSNAFSSNQNSWILQYNILWDAQSRNQSTTYQKLVSQASYGTGGYVEGGTSLKYVQEKSPVVINNTSDKIYDTLSSSGFGSLFLGSILKQYINGNNVSSSVSELNKRLLMLSPLISVGGGNNTYTIGKDFTEDNYFAKTFAKKAISTSTSEGLKDSQLGFSPSSVVSVTGASGYARIGNYPTNIKIPYSAQGDEQENTNAESILVPWVAPSNTIPFNSHTSFYTLEGVTPNFPNPYALNDKTVTASGLEDVYNKYFASSAGIPTPISKFNYYDETQMYDKNYGFFILTENIVPYFYSVWWDTFAPLRNEKDIGYLLQGSVEYEDESNPINPKKDANGNMIRNSILMNQSKIIDYLDLEELFKCVIPYCYQISQAAENQLGEEKIGDDYKIYRDNTKAWAFTSNWAVKLMNAFGDEIQGNTIWSEAHGQASSELAKLIQEFYVKLTPQVEEVLDKITTDGITKGSIIRYLALVSAIQFNKTFQTMGYSCSPSYIDVGSVTIDSLWKDILVAQGVKTSLLKSSAQCLSDNGNGLGDIFLLDIATVGLCQVYPFMKNFGIMAFYIMAMFMLIWNVTFGNQTNDFKAINFFVGMIVGFLKLLLIFSIPVILLLLFANTRFVTQSSMPLSMIFIMGAGSCIGTFILALNILPYHFGFIKGADGKLHFSFAEAGSLGGNTFMERAGNVAHSVTSAIKSIPSSIANAGSAIANTTVNTRGVNADTQIAIGRDKAHDAAKQGRTQKSRLQGAQMGISEANKNK